MHESLALVVAGGCMVFLAVLVSDFLGASWLFPVSVLMWIGMMIAIVIKMSKKEKKLKD